jgi:hypothetical protein
LHQLYGISLEYAMETMPVAIGKFLKLTTDRLHLFAATEKDAAPLRDPPSAG